MFHRVLNIATIAVAAIVVTSCETPSAGTGSAGPSAPAVSGAVGGPVRSDSEPVLEAVSDSPELDAVFAETSFQCRGGDGSVTVFTVSVNGGVCATETPNGQNQPTGAQCSNQAGSSASARCETGCSPTAGSGKCNQVYTPPPR